MCCLQLSDITTILRLQKHVINSNPICSENRKSRAISDPAPKHNEQTDGFDLRYSILQGF